jgi:hypothetical protein
MKNTGHAITLGHTAPQFRDEMVHWLQSQGLDG